MSELKVFKPDVLIVGAGIAGCPLAKLMIEQGHDVLLVERTTGPRHAFKGEFLQPSAVQHLKDTGFWSSFAKQVSSEITHLRFRDIGKDNNVASSIVMNYPDGQPGATIEYFDMIQNFIKITKDALGDSFWQGAELQAIDQESPDFISKPRFKCTHPQLGEVRIEPKWVVGCDGRQSSVRKWMGGKTPQKNGRVVVGAHDELIFGAQISEVSDNPKCYEVIRTTENGTISIFSLGERGQRIYFSSGPLSDAHPARNLSEHFVEVLKKTQSLTGLKTVPEKLVVSGYPANTCWFGPAAEGAFLLAGDALAVTTPYGGQGMNVAMEHVRFLAEKFDWKTNSKSKQALARSQYVQFAADLHKRISFLNFGVYYAFFSRRSFFKHSTEAVLNRWKSNPKLKDRVTRLFGGLDTDMPRLTEILDLENIPLSRRASVLAQKNIQWG